MNSGDPTHSTDGESSEGTTVLFQPEVHGDDDDLYAVGSMLDDRYKVEAVRGGRGRSGMGVVYIVEDGGEHYAVKTFQRRFTYDLTFIQRFIREARTWMLLGFHPNIVHAYQLDIVDAAPYLYMEYVPPDEHGRYSLVDYLSDGPLSPERTVAWGLQFCDGMRHATAAVPGLVHRDVKPENLLITPEGVLKITDFGLVRAREHSAGALARLTRTPDKAANLTQTGSVFGTPTYMAPEQFEAAGAVTAAADVYAFGCCLYECLAWRPPFRAEGSNSAKRVALLMRQHTHEEPAPLTEHDVPADLARFVHRCLEKNPSKRCTDYGELHRQLVETYRGLTGREAPQVPRADPTARQVAVQGRSLTLLHGYGRAIGLRNLREGQETSPYAFHLALASYFHCKGDGAEEQRQLLKATRCRFGERGYEAVRRLAELRVDEGEYLGAEALLLEFLEEQPDGLDQVLEPMVRLRCGQGRYDEALEQLEGQGDTMRTRLLRAWVLKQQGEKAAFAPLLRALVEEVLQRLEDKIEALDPADQVGWAVDGDLNALRDVMAMLRPDCDCSILDVVDVAIWPDLHGYPDFAPDMAWLSEALGELAQLGEEAGPDGGQYYRDCARLLDYPHRMARQRERDEYWFWMQHVAEE